MISVCNDMNYVKEFMTTPEVFRYAAEHGAEHGSLDFQCSNRKGWLSYMVSDNRVGLIDFEIMTGAMAMIHPYIMREYKSYYDAMIKEFFAWFIKFVPDQICKINVLIPDFCHGAIKASKTAGFELEGIDTNSYLSKYGACDRFLFGISRGNIKWEA